MAGMALERARKSRKLCRRRKWLPRMLSKSGEGDSSIGRHQLSGAGRGYCSGTEGDRGRNTKQLRWGEEVVQ